MGKRIFDICLAVLLLGITCLPMLAIAVLIKLVSKGPVLHWSHRVGRENRIYRMPKFRTMRVDAPQVATHLFMNADEWMIPVGRFLRAERPSFA